MRVHHYLTALLSGLLYQEEMKLSAVSENASYEDGQSGGGIGAGSRSHLEGMKRLSNGRSNMAGVGTNSRE